MANIAASMLVELSGLLMTSSLFSLSGVGALLLTGVSTLCLPLSGLGDSSESDPTAGGSL